eukprot:Amastigsp_a1296_12.p4 type:complete len:136 gc:universal Amastigsp_a1296_12:1479-1072(-)
MHTKGISGTVSPGGCGECGPKPLFETKFLATKIGLASFARMKACKYRWQRPRSGVRRPESPPGSAHGPIAIHRKNAWLPDDLAPRSLKNARSSLGANGSMVGKTPALAPELGSTRRARNSSGSNHESHCVAGPKR